MNKGNKKREYENQEWLDSLLQARADIDREALGDLDKFKAKLRHLDLSGQKIEGVFIVENFPKLVSLNVGENKLTSLEITNCPSLEIINCSHNEEKELKEISHSEVKVETRTPTLEKLTITNCPNIKELYCAYNKLKQLDTSGLDLRFLDYSNNNFEPEEQAKLDKLVVDSNIQEYEKSDRVPTDAQAWLDKHFPKDGGSILEGGYSKVWEETNTESKTILKSEFIPYKGLRREEVKGLDISRWCLKGDLFLEGFTNLEELDCSSNYYLTSLSAENSPKLKYLDASNNKLDYVFLPLGKNLETVFLNNNNLIEFDTDGLNRIKELSLTANVIEELDLSPLTNLETLNCALNRLKKLDLSSNFELRNLYCYKNKIKKLELNHLSNLENLYCYRNKITSLNCSGLKNLKEIYCADAWDKKNFCDDEESSFFEYYTSPLKNLITDGCDNLEILDCAENNLSSLKLINHPKLIMVSSKECFLEKITIENCPNLRSLDFSRQEKETVMGVKKINTLINIDDNSRSLKKIFLDRECKNVPNWEQFPNLELIGIGRTVSLYNNEKKEKESVFVMDIINVPNTKKIKHILNNPDDYSLNYLLKLIWDKKNSEGVPQELREKLSELITKKCNEETRKRLLGEDPEDSGEEENPDSTPPTEEPSEVPTPQEQEEPTPQDNDNKEDKDQLIKDLKKKIAKLQEENESLKSGSKTQKAQDNQRKIEEIRKEINNSDISKEQKQELLKLLEDLANKNRIIDNEVDTSSSYHNYDLVWIPVLIGQAALLSALIYGYWCDWKKAVRRRKYK